MTSLICMLDHTSFWWLWNRRSRKSYKTDGDLCLLDKVRGYIEKSKVVIVDFKYVSRLYCDTLLNVIAWCKPPHFLWLPRPDPGAHFPEPGPRECTIVLRV